MPDLVLVVLFFSKFQTKLSAGVLKIFLFIIIYLSVASKKRFYPDNLQRVLC